MINKGKRNVLGIRVDALDYESALDRIFKAAQDKKPLAVSALAVHGLMTGLGSLEHKYRLNHFHIVAPDGQPVRWALNLLHGTRLPDRVYGPKLTMEVCAEAARKGIPIFLYGSRPEVLEEMIIQLKSRFSGINIAGSEPSKFRRTSIEEKAEIAERIISSGARITLVGLGCPRQEVFCFEYNGILSMPVLAVGAAFDYLAGQVNEPPGYIQKYGLQWLYRLLQEPGRLWKRYLVLNPVFVFLLLIQILGIWRPSPGKCKKPDEEVLYG